MSEDLPENLIATSSAAGIVSIPTGNPLSGLAAAVTPAAQKKMAEIGIKGKKDAASDDPTDNDPCYLFELVKCAIESGAPVKEIDLQSMAPTFQEETKERTKKYTSSKILAFFTGGSFAFLMYLAFDFFTKLIGG